MAECIHQGQRVGYVATPQLVTLTWAEKSPLNALASQDGDVEVQLFGTFGKAFMQGGPGRVFNQLLRLHSGVNAGRQFVTHLVTTTRRFGGSPSDSLTRPAAATSSWTILRS